MPIPRALLEAVERRACELRIGREELIVRALRRELEEGAGWSAGFFERLSEVDARTVRDVNDMMRAIRRGRRSRAVAW